MFRKPKKSATISVSLTNNPRVFEHVCLLWGFVQSDQVPSGLFAQVVGELKGMAFAFRVSGNRGIADELLFLAEVAAAQVK